MIVSLAGNAIRLSSTGIARISLANPALSLVGHKIQCCPGGYEGLLSDAVFELSEQPSEMGHGPGVQPPRAEVNTSASPSRSAIYVSSSRARRAGTGTARAVSFLGRPLHPAGLADIAHRHAHPNPTRGHVRIGHSQRGGFAQPQPGWLVHRMSTRACAP